MGLRRRGKREAAWTAVEREAGEIIGARIAEGRPPPKAWSDAAKRHAAKGPTADAWYLAAAHPSESRRRSPSSPGLTPDIGSDLVLHVVQLPLAPAPPSAPGRRGVAVRRSAAKRPIHRSARS